MTECFACGDEDVQIIQDLEGTWHNYCAVCEYHFRNDYIDAEQVSRASAPDARRGT